MQLTMVMALVVVVMMQSSHRIVRREGGVGSFGYLLPRKAPSETMYIAWHWAKPLNGDPHQIYPTARSSRSHLFAAQTTTRDDKKGGKEGGEEGKRDAEQWVAEM